MAAVSFFLSKPLAGINTCKHGERTTAWQALAAQLCVQTQTRLSGGEGRRQRQCRRCPAAEKTAGPDSEPSLPLTHSPFADCGADDARPLRPRHHVRKERKVTQQASPHATRYLPWHKLIPGYVEASRRVKPNKKNNQTDLWEETQRSGCFLTE